MFSKSRMQNFRRGSSPVSSEHSTSPCQKFGTAIYLCAHGDSVKPVLFSGKIWSLKCNKTDRRIDLSKMLTSDSNARSKWFDTVFFI